MTIETTLTAAEAYAEVDPTSRPAPERRRRR
jgi:hypothetical protein